MVYKVFWGAAAGSYMLSEGEGVDGGGVYGKKDKGGLLKVSIPVFRSLLFIAGAASHD